MFSFFLNSNVGLFFSKHNQMFLNRFYETDKDMCMHAFLIDDLLLWLEFSLIRAFEDLCTVAIHVCFCFVASIRQREGRRTYHPFSCLKNISR